MSKKDFVYRATAILLAVAGVFIILLSTDILWVIIGFILGSVGLLALILEFGGLNE